MPYWLLTSTTYGTWLPGDPRGSVTRVRDTRPDEASSESRRRHSDWESPYEEPIEGLRNSAHARLKQAAVWLNDEQAQLVVQQFSETCTHRGWKLLAAAVMANHFHIVVGVLESTDSSRMLNDLNAYASRALNAESGESAPSRWWTRNGSRRRLRDERALRAAVHYVLCKQPHVLASWSGDADTPGADA